MSERKLSISGNTELPVAWLAVYELLELIPRGRVTTYGLIAQYLKITGGARSVGWALNHLNRTSHNLPAHRVVNRQGLLTGRMHFGDPRRMQALLESEGVEIQDHRVVEFSRLVWDPTKELRK